MFGVYQLNNDLKWEQIKTFEDETPAQHFKKMEIRKNTNPIRVFQLDAAKLPLGVDREDVVH